MSGTVRAAAAAALAAACGEAGGDAAAGEPAGAARVRSCETVFEYRPADPVARVEIAGEWTGWEPLPMQEEDGAWIAAADLPPGLHCYKLIAGGEWILDPANPYRAYCDGVENSGARVPDCTPPLLSLRGEARAQDAAFAARVLFSAGRDGAAPAAVRAVRVHAFQETAIEAGWDEAGWALSIRLDGLDPGKHTVRVTAEDVQGRRADPLLLPFWIEEEPFSWRDALIYLVMPDRFADGDPGNDPPPTPDAAPTADWQGGDLRGIADAIDSGHLSDLGVRALWITPWNQGALGAFPAADEVHAVTGYHGYWPVEPRAVDARFGADDDLRALVAAAHGRGIRVLMDFVVNHVHRDHVYVRDHPEWFRRASPAGEGGGCLCGTDGCDWTAERLTCLFRDYLPDLDWRNQEASEQVIADALWWLETFDLDGARIDAVKHVEDGAVFNLAAAVRERFETAGTDYYLDGETAMGWAGDDLAANAGEYGTINRYLGPHGLDGQFDFVLYHAVVERALARRERGMVHLDVWTGHSQTQYAEGAIMTPYLGTQDTSRLITLADYRGQDGRPVEAASRRWPEDGLPGRPADEEPYRRARVAFCWLLTIPGAPVIYQGDEYGEWGGGDPDNRHAWRPPDALDGRERALLDHVGALGRARRELRALRRGAYRSLGATETFLPFARVTAGGEAALVAINAAGAESRHTVSLYGTGLAGAPLRDALGAGTADVDGSLATLRVPPQGCAVFVR